MPAKGSVKRSLVSVTEILLVSGVVAVVGTILFPAVAQARARFTGADSFGGRYVPGKAKGLSQISAAVLQYATDTDGAFPTGCGSALFQPMDGGWVYSIKSYLPDMKALVAPKDPKSRKTWPDWVKAYPNAFNVSYASNGYMKAKAEGWGMYGLMGLDQTSQAAHGGWMTRGRTKQSEVTHPDDTVMFAESYGGHAIFGTGDVFTGINWYDQVGMGGLIPDGTRSKERKAKPYLVNGVVFSNDIRNGGMNAGKNLRTKQQVAFADGHVKAMPPVETNPDPVTHPELNKWDIEH